MSWNYRVLKNEIDDGFELTIREVYYSEEGKPQNYSDEPDYVYATHEDEDQIQSLRWQLERMLEALDKPILSVDDFK